MSFNFQDSSACYTIYIYIYTHSPSSMSPYKVSTTFPVSSLHRKNLPKDIFKWFLRGKSIIAPHGSTRVSLKTAHSIHWLIMILPPNHAIWISHRVFSMFFPSAAIFFNPHGCHGPCHQATKIVTDSCGLSNFQTSRLTTPRCFPGCRQSCRPISLFRPTGKKESKLGYVWDMCSIVQ